MFHHHGVEQQRYDQWRQSILRKVPKLSPFRDEPAVTLAPRNTPPLFGVGAIDVIPDDIFTAATRRDDRFPEIKGRVHRLKYGHIGRFGWKAQVASLRDFVLTACANELGLESPGHPQAPSPLQFDAKAPAPDLTAEECDALVAYVRSLPPPTLTNPGTRTASAVREGREVFESIGCAACHVPKLGPVEGIYSDLLLHDMGQSLSDGGNYYAMESDFFTAPKGSEWRTPPLWGLRDSAPYLHDGRARTWRDAVAAHGGEAQKTAERFARLSESGKRKIGSFLDALGPSPTRPSPGSPDPPPMDPADHAAARLAVARNLEKSGKLPAALDAYRELARQAPETEEGRAAVARLQALAPGEQSRPGAASHDGPSPPRGPSRSLLFTSPSGRVKDHSDR